MSSTLDAAVLLGAESSYGTPATLTRAYEAQADTFSRQMTALESVGFRGGMHTVRSDRRRMISQGAAGDITVDWLDRGMGLFLQAMLGSVSGPTSNEVTLTTSSDASSTSFTIQVLRPTDDGTLTPFTYHGCTPTAWTISQATGGFLTCSLSFDAEDEDITTSAGTPAYPTGAQPFDWTQVTCSIDGTDLGAVSSLELSGDLGMKTDRYYLRGSALKAQPKRVSAPTYSGSITTDFTGTDLHSTYTAGDIFDFQAVWTGDSFTGGTYTVTVDAPACQFDGETPAASLGDMTTATMPFRVLHDGSNPAVTITIESDDAAL